MDPRQRHVDQLGLHLVSCSRPTRTNALSPGSTLDCARQCWACWLRRAGSEPVILEGSKPSSFCRSGLAPTGQCRSVPSQQEATALRNTPSLSRRGNSVVERSRGCRCQAGGSEPGQAQGSALLPDMICQITAAIRSASTTDPSTSMTVAGTLPFSIKA